MLKKSKLQSYYNKFSEVIYFIRRFIDQPDIIGSICPSSHYLARAMVCNLVFNRDDLIVEYGPGTGSLTNFLLTITKQNHVKYLGIEKDPNLYLMLKKRFPSLDFFLGSAEETPSILRERGYDKANIILSSIPYTIIDKFVQRKLLYAIVDSLHESGKFRYIKYFIPNFIPNHFENQVSNFFYNKESPQFVFRNIPPTMIYSYSNPIINDVDRKNCDLLV